MRVKIRVNNGKYRDGTLEDLMELIHPMAAVAWDRDCGDIRLELPTDDESDLGPLRFNNDNDERAWIAYSGDSCNQIAFWDALELHWIRNTTSAVYAVDRDR